VASGYPNGQGLVVDSTKNSDYSSYTRIVGVVKLLEALSTKEQSNME
jgi:hypothetical protein